MPSSKQKNKKAVKRTESKAYKLPSAVVREIRKVASIYGVHGRAVQVGTEMLKRLPKPSDIPDPAPATVKRKIYRRSTRTPAKS